MNYFDRFLSPFERAIAVHELSALGAEAIPILESLFNGSAKNQFGNPYRNIGAVDCGYVTVKHLGTVAKPLEGHVKEGIDHDHLYAMEAAGYLTEIEPETAYSLARALIRHPASEAGASLVMCGYDRNAKVIEIVSSSSIAQNSLKKTKVYMANKT